jgi:hypothetical protein
VTGLWLCLVVCGVASNPLARVLLTVLLGDSDWFEVLWIGLVSDASGEGREAVAVVIIVAPAGTVPSPRFNDKPRVAAFIDFLPEVDRGGLVKVGLEWILVVMPCRMLLRVGFCTSYLLLPRADGWPLLHWRLSFLRLLEPPPVVQLTDAVSPWHSDLEC